MHSGIDDLKRQIQHNCNISDARYAGVYSLCGLLLRMRDLYKWEHRIPPWEEPNPPELLDWIESRESLWEELAGEELRPVEIDGQTFDPFDIVGINAIVRPAGLVYGAGYAIGMKPSFFLARLGDSKRIENLRIDTVHEELARDIFMSPAMRREEQVFARSTAMLFFLWDQILEMRPSAKDALGYGLFLHGMSMEELRQCPSKLGERLREISRAELDVWLYHEIGEVRETGFDGQVWHEIVAAYANSPVEILARVIKDICADTHPEGLLGHIVRNRIRSSFAFYAAFLRPFTRTMFPEILAAFRSFRVAEDWAVVEEARQTGRNRAHTAAETLVRIHLEGKDDLKRAKARITAELIEPLGIAGPLRDEDEDE